MVDAAQINEEVLCTLLLNQTTNTVELGSTPIEQHFVQPVQQLKALCSDPSVTLQDIIAFIEQRPEFNTLSAHYRYCQKLDGTYQAFDAKNEETIPKILKQQAVMLMNKEFMEDYDIDLAIQTLKHELGEEYGLWAKAYSINAAYRKCHNDKGILTFSHRISGWSNPVYRLTPNFTVELKTNFGFGSASYFYTKLTYKNIEITPVSEWIQYEIAKFSEIVRYTKLHALKHTSWLEALNFCLTACNTSLADEEAFVSKYIVEECEKMVKGLEDILVQDNFSIRKGRFMGYYPIDKKGHYLTEFRGEKISGALDFIDKILEFRSIASVTNFIQRIEACCKRIQPILVSELVDMNSELAKLHGEMDVLRPKYLSLNSSNQVYAKKRQEIRAAIVGDTVFRAADYPHKQINDEFLAQHPEYPAFEIEFKEVSKAYFDLSKMIENMEKVLRSITSHNNKISRHFGK